MLSKPSARKEWIPAWPFDFSVNLNDGFNSLDRELPAREHDWTVFPRLRREENHLDKGN
jgi:hypothetical protein